MNTMSKVALSLVTKLTLSVCVCGGGDGMGEEVSVKLMCNNNICLFNERVFHHLLFFIKTFSTVFIVSVNYHACVFGASPVPANVF